MIRGFSASTPGFVLATLALCIVVACTDEGVEPTPADVPTFHGTVDLEFGESEGTEPYLFTRIGSVMEDTRNRLLVADLQSHEVRVFDSEGDFLFRFGGVGEGPGDLTHPCCLAHGPKGLLWVRESGRYSVFRLDRASAEYERGARLAHTSLGLIAPVTFDEDGQLVDVGSLMMEDGAVLARLTHAFGGAVDTVIMASQERQATGSTTVDRVLSGGSVTLYVYQPFGPRWVHAHSPSGAWGEAITSEYVVTLHHPDGTVVRIEGLPRSGPRLSPSEHERAQGAIDRDLQRLDLRSHPFGIPDYKPPLAAIFFDRSGRLWIEKTGADGEDMREADVYVGSELVARYRWPRRVRVGSVPWVSDTKLYGTTRDSLDVQRVARVRFEPAS